MIGRLWRWFRGGHWERWNLEPLSGFLGPVWFRLSRCSRLPGELPPHPGCRGTPACEDYAQCQ